MTIKVSPDLSTGFFTRTRYNNVTKKIELTKKVLFSSFPGDSLYWTTTGTIWTSSVDKLTINSNGGNNFIGSTIDINQLTSKLTFRIKAKGDNISGNGYFGDYGIQIIPTYTVGGLSDNSIPHTPEGSIAFPTGTWDDQQFTIEIIPTQTLRYIYVYIFARNYTGTLTVWDAEVFSEVGNTSEYGEWKSEAIDLYYIDNKPMTDGAINMETIGFYYADISNVNELNNVERSKDVLSRYDYVVHDEPGLLSVKQKTISDYVKINTKIFGYTHIGWTPQIAALTDQTIYDIVDRIKLDGWHGVFFDMAGYDFGVTRSRLNTHVNYAHSKGLKVMANAWFPSDVLASDVNINTNSLGQQFNPTGTATSLGLDDFVLLESFYTTSNNVYVGETGVTLPDSIIKYVNAVTLAHSLNVKVGSLAYKMNTKLYSDLTDKNNSYILSLMCGVDAWSFGQTTFSEYDKPTFYTGTSLVGNLSLTKTNRWERNTNRGTLWFEAVTSPSHTRSSGEFSSVGNINATYADNYSSNFNSGLTDLVWQTSSDKLNWSTWANGATPSRFVRLYAKLTL